jgi:hypothetical protein
MTRYAPLLALALVLLTCCDVRAETRLYLANQSEFGQKLGFYLDFEGAKLGGLPVILGAADGTNWRFISNKPPFVPDRLYRIKGVVTPESERLYVDDKLVAESEGTWKPAPGDLIFNEQPGWASALGDWVGAVQSITVTVTRNGAQVAREDYAPAVPGRSVALRLFAADPPTSTALATRAGDTVTIEVALKFASADLRHYAPLIDPYGQCRYADWPEKVRSDADLKGDVGREDAVLARMPPSPDFDPYGGYLKAGWKETPTGFFRTLRREGVWWLVTPDGNPCFYLGVCSVPSTTWDSTPITGREYLYEWLAPKEAPWSAARSINNWGTHNGTEYASFYCANLIRKYGPEHWQQEAEQRAVRRVRAWGFSGVAKWGGQPPLANMPVLGRWGVPDLARHPDVFDPKVCDAFRKRLEEQVAPHAKDATIVGWSLGNEYDEIITPDEVKQILAKPAATPGKRALLDYAVDKLYGGSVAALASAWKLNAADRDALLQVHLHYHKVHRSEPPLPRVLDRAGLVGERDRLAPHHPLLRRDRIRPLQQGLRRRSALAPDGGERQTRHLRRVQLPALLQRHARVRPLRHVLHRRGGRGRPLRALGPGGGDQPVLRRPGLVRVARRAPDGPRAGRGRQAGDRRGLRIRPHHRDRPAALGPRQRHAQGQPSGRPVAHGGRRFSTTDTIEGAHA